MAFVSEREIQKFRNRRGQSGQGVIEYVLILIVVVSILLGGMYQLSEAFQSWANNYFGDYLTCLLETGELPSLGSSTTTGECAQLYREFSLAEGRPLVDGSTSESGTPREERDELQDQQDSTSGGSSGANAESASASGSVGSAGGGKRFRARRGGGGADEGSDINREVRAGPGAVGEINTRDKGRPERFRLDRTRNNYAKRLKEQDQEEAKARRPIADAGTGQKSGSKLIPVDRKISNEQKAPDVDGFTVGSFLRILLIAAIIIALLIFFGGQILQASKSMQ